MTGADRLTAAAALLRAAAEGTYSDGLEPWRVVITGGGFAVQEGADEIARCTDRGDAAYIALVSPAVAVAVADLLATYSHFQSDASIPGDVLAIADVVLAAEPLVAGVGRG